MNHITIQILGKNTLYEDYYVSISTFELTDDLGTTCYSSDVAFLFFEEYALNLQRIQTLRQCK